MYYLLILAVLVSDQLTKAYIHANMAAGQSISVIDGIFSITYVQNTGAAFSIFEGKQLLLTAIPVIFIIGIAIFMHTKGRNGHWTLKTAMALIAAGGAGNLIDRLSLGYVVDFFDFHIWPVFNIADIAVCVGCALAVIYVIRFDRSGEGKDNEA